MRHTRGLLWAFLTALTLAGCGYDVCVGPFGGNCYDQTSEGSSSTTTGVLTLTSTKSTLTQGEVITLTVTGGVAPYTFRTPTCASSPCGTVTSAGVYTAPEQTGVVVTIQVQDAHYQLSAVAVTVN